MVGVGSDIRVVEGGRFPPIVGRRRPVGVLEDAVHRAGVEALPAPRAELWDDDDVGVVVEDRRMQ